MQIYRGSIGLTQYSQTSNSQPAIHPLLEVPPKGHQLSQRRTGIALAHNRHNNQYNPKQRRRLQLYRRAIHLRPLDGY